jgi:uncharacterized protein (DUF302 family)
MKTLLAALALSTGVGLAVTAPLQAAEVAKKGAAPTPEVQMFDIGQTVLKMGLAKGVSPDDAGEAMRSKAAELNMKLVGYQNVGQEVANRGIKAPRLEIFQFCDPEDAVKMVQFNTIYAAYMPCRIAMVEDKDGQLWLMMLNLDMLINSQLLPPELTEVAIRVNQAMLDVMVAGATGEF